MTTETAFWGAASPRTNLISRLAAAFADARARRRTKSALAELDDYVLRDIGVDPSDVRRGRHAVGDWVLQSYSGTARLVFFGR